MLITATVKPFNSQSSHANLTLLRRSCPASHQPSHLGRPYHGLWESTVMTRSEHSFGHCSASRSVSAR